MLAVDLFAGVGGMSLGFKRAGFDTVVAVEGDKRHAETYAANFPGSIVLAEDIRNVTGEGILEAYGVNRPIDVIYGGPPCQGFSVIGGRKVEDVRNSLLHEFARIVQELRPRTFVVENVSGILNARFRPILHAFYQEMKASGYVLHDSPLVLNAQDFSVPQNRHRVFIIGVATPGRFPPHPTSVFKDAPEGLRSPNVGSALSDLPLLDGMDYLFDQDRYKGDLGEPSLYAQQLRPPEIGFEQEHVGIGGFLRTRHSEEVRARFAATKPGRREPISRFHKLDSASVAPTLRAGTTIAYGKFMAARPIHPIESRCITVREAARLHSFPDWFEFRATKWYGFMQIGNSVPPLLAQAVANSILSVL